ncbi:MAG TPA: HlyD family efflux transporter periplasmic adaptor subunit [Polyangiales bacterium]|jgi:HlyD family secretion protein|nr:HlyD family efflux transporter periplasmic adaptor subunit [Polyangiales bacterium]
MSKRKQAVLYIALAGMAVCAAALALALAPEPARTAPAPASPLRLVAPGRIEPLGEEIEVASQLSGVVAKVYVEDNAAVQAGQVLAELDRSSLEAQLAAAKADVELARAQLERISGGFRPQERREARARLREAQEDLSYAEREHARRLALQRDGAATEAELDRVRHVLDSASAKHSEAEARVELVTAPARSDELAVAEAEVAVAQARVHIIETELDKTRLRAPIAGTVLRRSCKVGAVVSNESPEPLFVLGDLTVLSVRAEIDELDVARIQLGKRAFVQADAYPHQRFAGTVTRVGRRVGSKSIHTDRAAERQDRNVLDAWITLDDSARLPVGLRVDAFIE